MQFQVRPNILVLNTVMASFDKVAWALGTTEMQLDAASIVLKCVEDVRLPIFNGCLSDKVCTVDVWHNNHGTSPFFAAGVCPTLPLALSAPSFMESKLYL